MGTIADCHVRNENSASESAIQTSLPRDMPMQAASERTRHFCSGDSDSSPKTNAG
jgi:hypothetical protein